MGVHIRIKCPECNGRAHHIDWICEVCNGTGGKLVWEENMGEAQGKLLQKQIDDAEL